MSPKSTSLFSGRFDHFLNEFDTDSDFETLPVQTTALLPPHESDLVGRLIEENQEIWMTLLNNKFCETMKGAGNGDQNFSRGFEWYMKQDYFYLANLINFEASRIPKAKTKEDLETALGRVSNAAKTTEGFFTTLTTARPNGLGIDPSTVLETGLSDVLIKYIYLINSTTKWGNWVLSKAVQICCYQSYYIIAANLHANSTHRDTLWYKFWVEVNFSYERSCRRQRQYFIDNYDSWKDHKVKITELFRETCQAELGLWDEAQRQSTDSRIA